MAKTNTTTSCRGLRTKIAEQPEQRALGSSSASRPVCPWRRRRRCPWGHRDAQAAVHQVRQRGGAAELMRLPPRKAAMRRFRDRSREVRISSRCAPMPTISPSSSTMIRSASITVATRCATMMTVACAVSRLRAARNAGVGLEIQRGETIVEEIDLRLSDPSRGRSRAVASDHPRSWCRPARDRGFHAHRPCRR